MTALDFAAVAAGAFFLGFVLGTALGRASARRCAHVFHGTPELVRWKYVRRCELCGAAEVSTSPIPQPASAEPVVVGSLDEPKSDALGPANEAKSYAAQGWLRECDDTDAVLRMIGLDPEQCRTDGGSLNVPKIRSMLRDRAAPLAYLCPAGCGCTWRDNGDGSMSLYGPSSRSCAACETMPLSKLLPVYTAPAQPASAEQQPVANRGTPGLQDVRVERTIIDRYPEINPSNYDHEAVCALNSWGFDVVMNARPIEDAPPALHEAAQAFAVILGACADTESRDSEKLTLIACVARKHEDALRAAIGEGE